MNHDGGDRILDMWEGGGALFVLCGMEQDFGNISDICIYMGIDRHVYSAHWFLVHDETSNNAVRCSTRTYVPRWMGVVFECTLLLLLWWLLYSM